MTNLDVSIFSCHSKLGNFQQEKKGGGGGGCGGVDFSAHAHPLPTPSANTPLFPFFHGRKLPSPESQGQEIYTVLYPISEISTLILCLDGGRGRESRGEVARRWLEFPATCLHPNIG